MVLCVWELVLIWFAFLAKGGVPFARFGFKEGFPLQKEVVLIFFYEKIF